MNKVQYFLCLYTNDSHHLNSIHFSLKLPSYIEINNNLYYFDIVLLLFTIIHGINHLIKIE